MKKTKKFNRAFDQYQDYFFHLKLKILRHHKKISIIHQGGRRFLKWKFRNNSRTFLEHINTFEEQNWRWKYYNNRFEGFLKKLNLIITKDKYKYQQEQNYQSLSIIKGISFKRIKLNHEKNEQGFLWNLKSKIQ